MYLSRLVINNYRSIGELDLSFKKGKNVIIGRNNAGKSNILKAINLILGENSPTYEKSENITENDFINGDTKKTITIFAQLTRGKSEKLNYSELYKCFGYYLYSDRIVLPTTNTGRFLESLKQIFKIDQEVVTKSYINPKLKNQKTFETQFEDKSLFAFAFIAYINENGRLVKNIRFLYRENESKDWCMGFSANIRNEFLQSAIIPSFRDPQNQLRISSWSWYGKLLKQYIDPKNEKLKKAFKQVEIASNEVFTNLQEKVNHSKVKIAFPNTSISFQFNPDSNQDVHKSVLIYVDDGFKSQLFDKGSGIQSAMIIGLFHFYTKEIAHNGSSLLAIEEPELYLHPHGKRVISDRLDDFLDGEKNQVIITTHASEFLNTTHENLNIIIVKKDTKETIANNLYFNDPKEKQILIKTQNAEMFFSDLTILVEGNGDKFILESIAKEYGMINSEVGGNWLNDNNISIIAVGGKEEFDKYSKKLIEANIKHYILSDFDFFKSGLGDYLTKLNILEIKEEHNGLNSKIGEIDSIENKDQLPDILKNRFLKFHPKIFEKTKIFLLSGDLENTFTDKAKKILSDNKINGKETKPLFLISQTYGKSVNISDYIKTDEFNKFLSLILLDNPHLKIRTEPNIQPKVSDKVEEIPVDPDDIPF